MKILDNQGNVLLERDLVIVETKNQKLQIQDGKDSGRLYVTGISKSQLACLPGGGHNVITIDQQD